MLLRQSFCSYFPPTPGGKWRNRQKSVGSYFFEIFPFVLGALCLMTAAPIVPHVCTTNQKPIFQSGIKEKIIKKKMSAELLSTVSSFKAENTNVRQNRIWVEATEQTKETLAPPDNCLADVLMGTRSQSDCLSPPG